MYGVLCIVNFVLCIVHCASCIVYCVLDVNIKVVSSPFCALPATLRDCSSCRGYLFGNFFCFVSGINNARKDYNPERGIT